MQNNKDKPAIFTWLEAVLLFCAVITAGLLLYQILKK